MSSWCSALRQSLRRAVWTGLASADEVVGRDEQLVVIVPVAADLGAAVPPLCPYLVGANFLPSLAQVEGVSRAKVVEVCVDVLTGRAEQMDSRDLHRLRVDEAGGSAYRVRADGAAAWRVALQVGASAARRLHSWRLRGGDVELARVGVHNDMFIS